MSRDRLFLTIVCVLVGMIIAYSLGIIIVFAIVDPADDLVIRFISSFGTIFAGILGLCTGYLIGNRNNGGK